MREMTLTQKIWEKGKAMLRSERRIRWIVLAGLVGIVLIFLSGFLSPDPKTDAAAENSVGIDEYTAGLENKILLLVTSMQGVGRANVMVTVEKEVLTDNSNSLSRNTSLIVDYRVQGVVIVCEGADQIAVAQRVTEAVTTAFHIPTTRVCVTKIN